HQHSLAYQQWRADPDLRRCRKLYDHRYWRRGAIWCRSGACSIRSSSDDLCPSPVSIIEHGNARCTHGDELSGANTMDPTGECRDHHADGEFPRGLQQHRLARRHLQHRLVSTVHGGDAALDDNADHSGSRHGRSRDAEHHDRGFAGSQCASEGAQHGPCHRH
ncbi:hypothetical protein LTR53_018965, partial [Teratosphaeriaceae sp. CCFEE 6253]